MFVFGKRYGEWKCIFVEGKQSNVVLKASLFISEWERGKTKNKI